jgi:hypothetical protein
VQHCAPDHLALAALREPLPADDAAHLAGCAECRAEVASLQRAVDALAVPQLAALGAAVPPPPRVWDAIAAATARAPEPPPAPRADVLPLQRRRRPVLLIAAAAVAGAVVGAGAVAVIRGGDDGAGGVTVANVTLAPLDDAHASGSASLVKREDGTRVLRLDLEAPGLSDGYYEAWLLEPSVTGMVPLGVVESGETDFELPPSLDLGRFPMVDVSVEPMDGNPAHSGDSVVRGKLAT